MSLGQALDEFGVHEQPHFPDDCVGGVAVGISRLHIEVGSRFRGQPVAGFLHSALGSGGYGDDDAARLVGLHEADVRGGPAAQLVDQCGAVHEGRQGCAVGVPCGVAGAPSQMQGAGRNRQRDGGASGFGQCCECHVVLLIGW